VLARVLVTVVAVTALVWLGVCLRDLNRFERGERLALAADAGQAQIGEAADLIGDSRLFNPDTRPLLSEGALLIARAEGRAREGRDLIEEAVRREPDNVVAWGVLASATRRIDPERSRVARARARELSPPVDPE
jgi:hypothetical protein